MYVKSKPAQKASSAAVFMLCTQSWFCRVAGEPECTGPTSRKSRRSDAVRETKSAEVKAFAQKPADSCREWREPRSQYCAACRLSSGGDVEAAHHWLQLSADQADWDDHPGTIWQENCKHVLLAGLPASKASSGGS